MLEKCPQREFSGRSIYVEQLHGEIDQTKLWLYGTISRAARGNNGRENLRGMWGNA